MEGLSRPTAYPPGAMSTLPRHLGGDMCCQEAMRAAMLCLRIGALAMGVVVGRCCYWLLLSPLLLEPRTNVTGF